MQQNYPFQPRGGVASTTNVAVTASSQQLTLPTPSNNGGSIMLTNVGTQTVFVSYGSVTASVSTSMPLLANAIYTFTLPPGVTQLSAIAASTGSTLYATLGDGQ